jgi:hypothetical protein
MAYLKDGERKEINTEIDFIGKGFIDGKSVEINFKTSDISVEYGGKVIPILTIIPSFNKEKGIFFEMKTINEDKKDPFKINGKYIVMFKKPNSRNVKNETTYQTFEGVCENFVTTGKCAFSNEDGEMLIVHYDDIVQLKPIID